MAWYEQVGKAFYHEQHADKPQPREPRVHILVLDQELVCKSAQYNNHMDDNGPGIEERDEMGRQFRFIPAGEDKIPDEFLEL